MQKTIFITGVSGSGKTTVGKLLAKQLSIAFFDGDDFHPDHNIEKMKNGFPLNDDDRWSWLEAIRQHAIDNKPAVIACSALKEKYRTQLTQGLNQSDYQFIHLKGKRSTILKRMQQRSGHFMPTTLLDSQFDTYEEPQSGHIINIEYSLEQILKNTLKMLNASSSIGIIGLGVMGTSIARNIGRNGYKLSLYNRHVDGKEENVAKNKVLEYDELSESLAFDEMATFVNSISLPRKILLMVNAGQAVDSVIADLIPYLDHNDIIIDGGNSNYKDTQRRYEQLKSKNIRFIGCGISGGEEGALLGPSMMPGSDKETYNEIKEVFETIAAKSPLGHACCSHIGIGGSGHFVKMVHNGIEYGEMQLIAECYSFLRFDCHLTPSRIADIFEEWKQAECDSYLLDITISILNTNDSKGILILDQIYDQAGNKGTGAWTTKAATELGVAIPTITAALFARYQSFFKQERVQLSDQLSWTNEIKKENSVDGLKELYQTCRIINHRQGLDLIKAASDKFNWNIDINKLLTVWSAGCIIRSSLLLKIQEESNDKDFLNSAYFKSYFETHKSKIKSSFSELVNSENPTPAISASVEYFKSLIQKSGSANLIQAQRDYFGAHTFKWTFDPDGPHIHYDWNK